MRIATLAIVVCGLALALGLGFREGFDATSVTILALIVATGAVAIAAVSRSEGGAIAPARCTACDGVISATAPYCKHCGAPQE